MFYTHYPYNYRPQPSAESYPATPRYPVVARERYLAVLAKAKAAEAAAKAAEADYLAAVAIDREEEALRARLQELQQQRYHQASGLHERYYNAPPFPASAAFDHTPVFPYGPNHGAPIAPIRDSGIKERLQARLLKERAARILLEEQLDAKEREAAVLRAQRKQTSHRPINTAPSAHLRHGFAGDTADFAHDMITLLQTLGIQAQREPTAFSQPIRERVEVASKAGTPASDKQASTANASVKQPEPDSQSNAPELQGLQQVLEALFGQPTRIVNEECSNKAESNSTRRCDIPHPSMFHTLGLAEAAQHTPPKAHTPSKAKETVAKPVPVELSLVEQLQARYQTEGADEIRDTIQAIFNSLTDNPAPKSSFDNSSSKGKTKEPSSSSASAHSEEFTSKDVVESLERVQNIEAAFQGLESDFVFPAQLDFISRKSPTSDETTAISRLAFTARNHSVRFYEQTLSALLTQLDLIDSRGNETLRGKRKEIVNLIENALEVLEREVAGRWNAKIAKAGNDDHKVQLTPSTSQESFETVTDTKLSEGPFVTRESIHSGSDSELASPVENAVEDPIASSTGFQESDASAPVNGVSPQVLSNTDGSLGGAIDQAVGQGREAVTPTEEAQLNGTIDDTDSDLQIEVQEEIAENLVPLNGHVTETFSDALESEGVATDDDEQDSDDSDNSFLLSQPKTPEVKAKNLQRASVEDLGSDWSDVDA